MYRFGRRVAGLRGALASAPRIVDVVMHHLFRESFAFMRHVVEPHLIANDMRLSDADMLQLLRAQHGIHGYRQLTEAQYARLAHELVTWLEAGRGASCRV